MAGGFSFGSPVTIDDMIRNYRQQQGIGIQQAAQQAALQQQAANQQQQQAEIEQQARQVAADAAAGKSQADVATAQAIADKQQDHQQAASQQALAQVQAQRMAQAQQAAQQSTQPVLSQGLLGPTPQAVSHDAMAHDAMALQFERGLMDYKKQYAQAQAAGDEAGMTAASQSASALRDAANKQGIDTSIVGSDRTLAQAIGAMQGNQIGNYGKLFDTGLSSDRYYSQEYDRIRANGGTRSEAAKIAGDKAAIYQAQRLADLSKSFYAYGITPEGAINNYGTQIMDEMHREDSNSIAIPNSYYAKPVNDYTWIRGEQSRDAQMGRQKGMATFNEGLQEKYGQFQTSQKKDIMGYQTELNKQIIAAQQEAKEHGMRTQAEIQNYMMAKYPNLAAAKSKNGNGKKDTEKVSDLISTIKLADKWDEDHPDNKSDNPYRDAADDASKALESNMRDTQSRHSVDPDDYQGMYSWAQGVLEENYRKGYPASADGLYQAISNMGGYGPQIAEELKGSGMLDQYGK